MQRVMSFHTVYKVVRRKDIIIHLVCANLTFMTTMRDALYYSCFVASASLPLVNLNYKIALCSASARFTISHGYWEGRDYVK